MGGAASRSVRCHGIGRLQYPDLAAQQLEDATKRHGLRGVSIGGHVNGEDLSTAKVRPILGQGRGARLPVFMHPGGADNIIKDGALRRRGDLGNIIGNPLETTYFLSRLIFDGTFDKFPGLRVCAAHAGGYLPSYLGRSEVACTVRANANCANKRRPSEYPQARSWWTPWSFPKKASGTWSPRSAWPGRLRHGHAIELAGHHGSRPGREVPHRRGEDSDPRRQPGAVAQDQHEQFRAASAPGGATARLAEVES